MAPVADPSNSLASVHGLTRDIIERQGLGPEWAFDVVTIDETNTVIDLAEVSRRVRGAKAGLVMLIGVQSNQFPRALDIARPLLADGVQVVVERGIPASAGMTQLVDGA